MKAVILAAGIGKRLRPLTYEIPKPMIDIAGKPLLERIILDLKKYGITDAVIVVNYMKEKIMDFFGDGKKFGMNIQYVIQKNPEGGTADAVRCAEKNVKDENFIVISGDELRETSVIEEMKRKKNCDGVVTAYRGEDPKKYGVLEVDDERVLRIREKEDNPVSDLINVSFYRLFQEVFNTIRKIKPSPRGELEITDAVNLLIDEGFVFHFVETKYYFDIGSIEELERARKYFEKLP